MTTPTAPITAPAAAAPTQPATAGVAAPAPVVAVAPAVAPAADPATLNVQHATAPVVVPVMASSASLAAPAATAATAAPAVRVDEPTVTTLQAEMSALRAGIEAEKVQAAVLARIKPEHAKEAALILATQSGKGGVKARVAQAEKFFEAEFPAWVKPAEGAAAQPGQPQQAGQQPQPGQQRPISTFPNPGAPAAAGTAPTGLVNKQGVRMW